MEPAGGGGMEGPWEDEETRQFYVRLPELRDVLPGILFRDSEQPTLAPMPEKIDYEDEEDGDAPATEQDDDAAPDADEPDDEVALVVAEVVATGRSAMGAFACRLPTLVNRELIDAAAMEFVTTLNTRGNRAALARALYAVPRTRLDLLPFYARMVAILAPVIPDLPTELAELVRGEFRRRVRKKDQTQLESKVKVARYVGELTKFGAFPKSEALHCLKMLLFDFRHHNIDMACALLDAAGYFLLHSSDSRQKTKLLLEQMMRKRAASALDARYELMIDNAFYQSDPPAGGAAPPAPPLPPLHAYIQRLVFGELAKGTVEKVLRQLRKIDWEGETADYVIWCLSSPHALKFSSIQWLASLLAGLMWYYDWVGYRVVDNVLEDIRVGMEINHPTLNQRRVAMLKYLGEMYNYRVTDSTVIFATLYSLITFGCDAEDHLLRIRLASVLLETCGEYFSTGSSGRKLDCYLAYLQRYYCLKLRRPLWTPDRPFPLDARNLMRHLLHTLRPKVILTEDLDEANAAVKRIEDDYKHKICPF